MSCRRLVQHDLPAVALTAAFVGDFLVLVEVHLTTRVG
jgi:hypothetical protein